MDATLQCATCWGAQLHGGAECTPQFVPGKLHFKNNFCDNCRTCIQVPLTHICALSAEQAACFVNKFSKGFWNEAPAHLGGGQYRIINNTAGCIGPWLALFRKQPPQLEWSATRRSNAHPNLHLSPNASPSPNPHSSLGPHAERPSPIPDLSLPRPHARPSPSPSPPPPALSPPPSPLALAPTRPPPLRPPSPSLTPLHSPHLPPCQARRT